MNLMRRELKASCVTTSTGARFCMNLMRRELKVEHRVEGGERPDDPWESHEERIESRKNMDQHRTDISENLMRRELKVQTVLLREARTREGWNLMRRELKDYDTDDDVNEVMKNLMRRELKASSAGAL